MTNLSDNKDLIHILKLLDDESPKVRSHVWEKLEANLPKWEMDIRSRMEEIPGTSRKRVEAMITDYARNDFRENWLGWRNIDDEVERLETALASLSYYLSNLNFTTSILPQARLSNLLDSLAKNFLDLDIPPTGQALAEFLFKDEGISGADSDYYDPANSDLTQVIERRRGIPLSLACIFMLVGHRLGLEIYGCDVPEHFLTRVVDEKSETIIDCFDGGKVLGRERLSQLEMKYTPDFSRLLKTKATPESIVARVLRNLINAFHLTGNKLASEFMWSLADDLRINVDGPDELGDEDYDEAPREV